MSAVDFHEGERYESKKGKPVTVVQIDSIADRVRIQFGESGASRWVPADDFLARYRPVTSTEEG